MAYNKRNINSVLDYEKQSVYVVEIPALADDIVLPIGFKLVYQCKS